MLTCMKPRLLWLQKSTNESACGLGIGVVLGATGPGLTSTSSGEQGRSRIRVRLKAIRTGRLVRWEQRIKRADFWTWWNSFRVYCTGNGMVGCEYSGGKPRH